MKKIFGTLFVALILTVTAASPAFAFGPASSGRPAPPELAPAESGPAELGPADEEEVTCYYGGHPYSPGDEFYRGRFRPTLVCQSDGTWTRK